MSTKVAILHDKFAEGVCNLSQLSGPVALERRPLAEALESEYQSDAHLLCYYCEAPDGEQQAFRINKRSPAPKQLEEAGCRILANLLVFDHDLPKVNGVKQPWSSPEAVDEFCDRLVTAYASDPAALPAPTAWYTTNHGSRFVFELAAPIPVAEAEGLCKAIIERFGSAGILLDRACFDWTRLFRLPKVHRDGQPTWERDTFRVLLSSDVLDASTITPVASASTDEYALVQYEEGEQPDPSEARALLWRINPDTGKEVQTAWRKTSRAYLKGRDCFPYIFEEGLLADAERDTNLFRLIGSTVGLLFHREGASMASVYALWHDCVAQLEPTENHPDWLATVWSMVVRIWNAEAAQHAARKAEYEDKGQEAEAISVKILDTMREAHPHDPELNDVDNDALEAMRGRLIAGTPKGYFIMRPDGNYSRAQVTVTQLVSEIRHLGMEGVIETHEMAGQVWRPKRAQAILDEYMIPVQEVESSPAIEVPKIEERAGGRTLLLPVHKLRTDLWGEYNKDVDRWLRLLFGDKADLGLEWLSHCLDVKRPICAIDLVGASGAGKGMLVQGIAECFECADYSDGKALGKYNEGLLGSPIVNLDEDVPVGHNQDGRSPDAVFRSMVSGGNIRVEAKFKNPISARIYPRLIFTSNNLDILSAICGKRILGPDDIEALKVRLLHIQVPLAAAAFLTERGNYIFTRGWVQGDQPSRCTLAKHILWLYENRTPSLSSSGRLLVEGERESTILRDVTLSNRSGAAVIRCICLMLESRANIPGCATHAGVAYVSSNAIMKYHENNFAMVTRQELSNKSISQVLRLLCNQTDLPSNRVLPHDPTQRGRWWCPDPEILLEYAERDGYPHHKLAALVDEYRLQVPKK